jgi:D-alanyl-D-alanine-carboxypeptidase/D-alanyl-D-alanine-endopeptidase
MHRIRPLLLPELAALGLILSLNACGVLPAAPTDIPAAPQSAPPTSTIAPEDVPEATATAATTASATLIPTAHIPDLQDAALQRQIDKLAASFVGQGTNSGMGVAVVERDPSTHQLEAMELNYGTTGKGSGQQVTSDTVYEIGSVTKLFTGILLAEDVSSGKVQLNDPIQNYLPPGVQAPAYNGISITLDDLATHHSGLPRDINTDEPSEMYNWLNGFQLSTQPGSRYLYSNVGYSLLGDILARLASTDFNTLEFRSVSQPLGMSDTGEALDTDENSRLAQGYTLDGSPAQYFPESGAMSAAGYLRSTLGDMTRFLIANMQPDATPLSDAIQMAQALQAEGKNPGTGVALGWEIDQLGTTNERLYKGGGTYGFTSYITFMRDGSYGFVVLTNGPNAETLVPRMLNIIASTR